MDISTPPAGNSGDLHHTRFGADAKSIDNGWVDKNIQQNHGPPGKLDGWNSDGRIRRRSCF
jgi:hypothetical protein